MEIYSFVSTKGGVGKTSIAYNFATFLAERNKTVLIIDQDHQCSISQLFDCDTQNNTVKGIYTEDPVDINNVRQNIDLITGDYYLDKTEDWVISQPNTDTRLLTWVTMNLTENLNLSQYDYIIIDTHPDFRTATRNAVAVSDKIISPDVPGANNEETKGNTIERYHQCIKEIKDPISMESYVTAKLYLVGNRIKHNTESSRRFVRELKEFDNYLTYFREKELFINATVKRTSVDKLMELKENQRKEHIEFYDHYKECFEKFLDAE
ncbi:ParA family protein [Staphylococcus caprae]|uniref:ParA family protein n=1 Tax=Staphylococcus caprae TaxID=29380 RepID=UPI000CD07741|nr:ParA family protein [Staphylococcus caprae]POA06063.1 ParA family protein [Staphylococcus caprae]SUL89878.1 Sporulation initiation inhibitor protein soj [Staphylococcus caprae]